MEEGVPALLIENTRRSVITCRRREGRIETFILRLRGWVRVSGEAKEDRRALHERSEEKCAFICGYRLALNPDHFTSFIVHLDR
jgi:hypothetical protein